MERNFIHSYTDGIPFLLYQECLWRWRREKKAEKGCLVETDLIAIKPFFSSSIQVQGMTEQYKNPLCIYANAAGTEKGK